MEVENTKVRDVIPPPKSTAVRKGFRTLLGGVNAGFKSWG